MKKRNRIELRVESLEALALLSTLPALPGLATGSTGLGSIGSVSVSDAQALQQDSSGGSLEEYVSQLEVLYGKRSNVKTYAADVVVNHSITNYDLQNVASEVGVTLPSGIALPSDVADAQKVLASVRSGGIDTIYLKVMKQINAQDIADDVELIGSTASPYVKLYAQETAAYDQNHVMGAQQLLSSPKSTYHPAIATTSISSTIGAGTSTAASASDAQSLSADESGGALELFISQVEEQSGKRTDAQAYAQTVVADHQSTNYDLQATAVATNVTLPSGITVAADVQDAEKVLKAVRSGTLDSVYLSVMDQINSQDVTADQQLIASTSSSRIAAYAQETMSYDMTHLAGAQMLLSQKSATYTPSSS